MAIWDERFVHQGKPPHRRERTEYKGCVGCGRRLKKGRFIKFKAVPVTWLGE
jgi:hypothetical protein